MPIDLPAVGVHPDQPGRGSRSVEVITKMITGFQEILDRRIDGKLLRRRSFFFQSRVSGERAIRAH